MRKKRRILILMLALAMLLQLVPAYASGSGNAPTRIINLVYDDSGSMIYSDGKVDRWCQAKYAMEVFAAMLGEKDTMNIYFMSEFEGSGSWASTMTLKGSNGAGHNVEKIHNNVTSAGNTPFASVQTAYKDLTKTKADEKWLVVLTDGEFQGSGNISSFFGGVSDNIKVMFLSMGADAPSEQKIAPSGKSNFFFASAASSNDILNQITGICTRVFNSNKISCKNGNFSFDIPMSQLVVFAQGEDVKIGKLSDNNGKAASSASQVTVRYSEVASTTGSKYDDPAVNKDLKGIVATFDGDFGAGDYELDISGAKTVEVYYKPNVDIAAYLVDSNGNEVKSNENLRAGDFTINFGFVKAGTDEKVPESKLLGDVSYSAIITNNGEANSSAVKSNDKIHLDEGKLSIEVVAKFLEYNTVSTSMNFTVYQDKTVTFEEIATTEYQLKDSGFKADNPIQIKAMLEGKELTTEQWSEMTVPTVDGKLDGMKRVSEFVVEKSDTAGVFNVYPAVKENKLKSGLYSGGTYNVSYESKHGEAVWSGFMDGSFKVNDSRSWGNRYHDAIVIGIISLAIFGLLLGYIPGVKKYLPKSLANSPHITHVPHVLGMKANPSSGRLTKMHTFIPYIAEEGNIKVSQAMNVTLHVKAKAKHKMLITNAADLGASKKYEVWIDGKKLTSDKNTHVITGAFGKSRVVTPTMEYECTFNRAYRTNKSKTTKRKK